MVSSSECFTFNVKEKETLICDSGTGTKMCLKALLETVAGLQAQLHDLHADEPSESGAGGATAINLDSEYTLSLELKEFLHGLVREEVKPLIDDDNVIKGQIENYRQVSEDLVTQIEAFQTRLNELIKDINVLNRINDLSQFELNDGLARPRG